MSHKLDTEFAKRKADNLKRKLSSVPQPGPSSAEPSLAVDDSSDDEEIDHQDNDEEYVDKSRKEKRSEMITVRVPKNVFMSDSYIITDNQSFIIETFDSYTKLTAMQNDVYRNEFLTTISFSALQHGPQSRIVSKSSSCS